MKGIITDLDKGFYEDCRQKHLDPLTQMTRIIKPEPAEIADTRRRLSLKLLDFDPDGERRLRSAPMLAAIDKAAYQLCGLEKEMAARGITGSDTVEKAFFSSANGPNQPLFPVWLAGNIIAGQLATSLVPVLAAAMVTIDSHVQEKVTISDSKATRELKHIGEGDDLPKTTISHTGASVQLSKYGRMIEATYESVKLMHLDILALTVMRMGSQIGIDQTDDLIEVLISGDGTSGSAMSTIGNDVAGTTDYDDYVKLFLTFPIGYKWRQGIISDTQIRTQLSITEFKDPTAGMNFQGTGMLPGPLGVQYHRWNSPSGQAFTTTDILAVDNTQAVVGLREGDMLEEADKLIDKQIHRRTLSEWVGFMKWDNNASQLLRNT